MLRLQSATSGGSTFTLAFAAIVVRGLKRARRLVRNRIAVASLCELDDRALKDIGLTRSDVNAALALPLVSDPSEHLMDVAGHKRSPARENVARKVDSRLRSLDADVKAAAGACPA